MRRIAVEGVEEGRVEHAARILRQRAEDFLRLCASEQTLNGRCAVRVVLVPCWKLTKRRGATPRGRARSPLNRTASVPEPDVYNIR
jgi:hypothetical protein